MPRAVTRRALLGGAALVGGAGALAGCSKKPPQEIKPQPDVGVLLRAVTAEDQLIRLYESTKQAHPDLGRRIDPLLAHHREHRTVLLRHIRPGSESSGGAPLRMTLDPDTDETAPPSRRQAVAALRTAERKAAAARTADLALVAPGMAQLFASIAACETGHAAWLTRLA